MTLHQFKNVLIASARKWLSAFRKSDVTNVKSLRKFSQATARASFFSDHLAFRAWNGTAWAARWEGALFGLTSPRGVTNASVELRYLDWEGIRSIAFWNEERRVFIVKPAGSERVGTERTRISLQYLDANGMACSAMRRGDSFAISMRPKRR